MPHMHPKEPNGDLLQLACCSPQPSLAKLSADGLVKRNLTCKLLNLIVNFMNQTGKQKQTSPELFSSKLQYIYIYFMIPRDDHSIPNMYRLQKGGCNFYSLAMELIRWQVGPIAIVIQARV